MNEQPAWRLTDEAITRIVMVALAEAAQRAAEADEYRPVADAQARKLAEWFSRQLFDEENMDESLDMSNGVITAPRWLVQLRKDVGL